MLKQFPSILIRMCSSVYVRQKVYKFGRNWLSTYPVVLEIRKAEFGNSTVPVNNTLVCCASSFVFLVADTLPCILILSFDPKPDETNGTP